MKLDIGIRTLRSRLSSAFYRGTKYLGKLPLPESISWRFSTRRFQPFNYTGLDRYPWLFSFARDVLKPESRILSFGCSTGEEMLSLRRYFPLAIIKGIDIDPRNISAARRRVTRMQNFEFSCAATAAAEEAKFYDAVFCLAVLCNGYLTAARRKRSDPLFYFERFEAAIEDLTRCLKPGRLLFLLTTNFRFRDTRVAAGFDLVLSAREDQLAPDLIYDRNNRLLEGERYCEAVFRKRCV